MTRDPITEKPRVVDWNAWLGDVPDEKRHVRCVYCNPPGPVVSKALCGVAFIPLCVPTDSLPVSEVCLECLELRRRRINGERVPCPPTCPVNRRR